MGLPVWRAAPPRAGPSMRNLLGGKGANLAEMSNLGLPVPPGFTITTEVCTYFYANGKTYPPELNDEVGRGAGRRREGARRAIWRSRTTRCWSRCARGRAPRCPGMMDTVLNLGLNDETVEGLARRSGDERFAYDSYRRFHPDVRAGRARHRAPSFRGADREPQDRDRRRCSTPSSSAEDWQTIVAGFKDVVATETGKPFPQEPQEQLWGAIGAVFGSWMNPRAVTYRRLHDIPADWGTAVNVQAMVFGNMGEDCATGVAFTRNPSTGANEFYGEYLVNAQGEDVVAGIRTPQHLTVAGKQAQQLDAAGDGRGDARGVRPSCCAVRRTLEDHYRDMQDIEFTVERGKLWMLQTRTGKRTAQAALKIAVSLVEEGVHRPRGGDPAHRAGFARPAAAPDARPQREDDGAGARSAGLARRRLGQGRVLGRRSRSRGGTRRGGDPGADRDQPRGHPRHARRQGHPDDARRHDQPRRRRRARHGAALRRRRRRSAHRLRGRHDGGAQPLWCGPAT